MIKKGSILLVMLALFSFRLFAGNDNMVMITVQYDVEGASVVINNTIKGRIHNGSFKSEIARNITADVKITSEGYYPEEVSVFTDDDIVLELESLAHYKISSGLNYNFGGGSMSSVSYRWYPITNRLFTDYGAGFTLQDTEEIYLKFFFTSQGGVLFFE